MTECQIGLKGCLKLTVVIAVVLVTGVISTVVSVYINRLMFKDNIPDKHWGAACGHGPCQNGGTCTLSGTTYTCTCTENYLGRNCDKSNPCFESDCRNGGNCTVSGEAMVCSCPHGFSGLHCEHEKSPCDSNPCQNGGSCSQVGSSNQCACRTGYFGKNCEKDDPCLPDPCKNGGSCSVSGDNQHCACPTTHYGKICEFERNDETECQKVNSKLDSQGIISIITLSFVCPIFIHSIGLIIYKCFYCVSSRNDQPE